MEADTRQLAIAPTYGLPTRRRRFGVVTAASWVAMVAYLAYAPGSIENATLGSYLDRALLSFYLVFFLGLPIVALISPFDRAARTRMRMVGTATVLLIVVVSVVTSRAPLRVAPDDVIYASSATRDGDLLGIDAIRRCFEEPLKVMHSELGVPGVLFPESKVIDYTGLANPSIVDRSFDFESLCRSERPDFVFRPHRTHRKPNEELSASPCLAEKYTLARLPHPSACPLYV